MASAYTWHSIRIGLACALFDAKCPDSVIQLICRWASPDSLKAYRRLGVAQNLQWVDRAQRARIDAVQVPNLPRLDNQPLVTGEQPPPQPPRPVIPAAPPLPSPPQRNARGEWRTDDVALVPRDLYPAYACAELGGAGWLARVVSCRGQGPNAVLRLCFLTARTPSGRQWEDVRLLAHAVRVRPA